MCCRRDVRSVRSLPRQHDRVRAIKARVCNVADKTTPIRLATSFRPPLAFVGAQSIVIAFRSTLSSFSLCSSHSFHSAASRSMRDSLRKQKLNFHAPNGNNPILFPDTPLGGNYCRHRRWSKMDTGLPEIASILSEAK
jgi:hypothetical protein